MLTQKVVSDFIAEQRRCSSSVIDALQNVRKQILHLHQRIPHRHEMLHTCQNDVKNMVTVTDTNVNWIPEDCQIQHENNETSESEIIVDLFQYVRNSIVRSRHAGRLYRVRGMIQQIQSEMHLFSASRSNFFSTPQDESDEELLDAMLLYVVPVPGNLHFYLSYNDDNDKYQTNHRNCRTAQRQSETFSSRSTASLQHDTNAAKSHMQPLLLSHFQESKANSNTSKDMNNNDKVTISRKRWQTKRLDNQFDNSNAYKVKKQVTTQEQRMQQNGRLILCQQEQQQQYQHQSQQHRQIKTQLCTAGKEQKGLFSINSYLNLPHSALSRDLQSACVVTILAPKMHIKSIHDQNKCNRTESIIDEDEQKQINRINSFNHHDNSNDNNNDNNNTNNDDDDHNVKAQLHVNDIVDFYGFVQQPQSQPPQLLQSQHDSTNADRYNSSTLHRCEQNSSKLCNSGQDYCCEEMYCYNDCNEQCNSVAQFDQWRALQLSSLLVPRLVCLAYVHVNSTPSSFTLSSCKKSNKLTDQHTVQRSQSISTQARGLPCYHNDDNRHCHYYYYQHPSRFALYACSCIAQMQPRVVQYLAHHICQGDMLLSEYLLLHLCGRTVAHTTITPVGDVPLCVYAPNMDAYTWSAALRQIVPIAQLLIDKSLLLASRMQLNPQHDMRQNYLRTGLLQVGNGTHLTFNCDDLMSLFSGDDDVISSNEQATTTTTNNFNNRDVDSNNDNNNSRSGIFAQENELSCCQTNWKDVLFSLLHKQLLLLDYPYQTLELPVDVSVLALCTSNNDNDNYSQPITTQSHKCIDSILDNKKKDTSATTVIPSLFDFALKLPWKPMSASLLRKAITEQDNSNNNSSNSQQITTSAAAGNVLLTSHEVRAYLFTIRRINPCFDYEECTQQNLSGSNDSSDNEHTSIHVAITQAFTKLSKEMPQWVNRDALVHNNTFSAVTALLRARAVSCGRSRVSRDDLQFVLSLQRQRVKRLQQN